MQAMIVDRTDVPAVSLHDLYLPLKHLIAEGRGLAMLNGLSEAEIRSVETHIWEHFSDAPEKRVAVALRFRSLLQVFSARRLQDAFLQQGFKLIALAVAEGAHQRLNMRFGFKAQAFVMALDPACRARSATAARPRHAAESTALSLAA